MMFHFGAGWTEFLAHSCNLKFAFADSEMQLGCHLADTFLVYKMQWEHKDRILLHIYGDSVGYCMALSAPV